MRILFTGGGTGGHIFPIIAVKEAFSNAGDFQFYYLGPDDFAKENLINPPTGEAGQNIKTKFILAGKFRRYFSLNTPLDLIKIFIGIFQAFWYLFLIMPDVIFSKGGYGSFPVVLIGWIYRIPIVLHESDSAPGLANRILAKFAKKIILSFPSSEKYFIKYKDRVVVIGNPVRKELLTGDKNQGRGLFKLTSNKPVLLIIGGSQGAQKINEIVLNTLPRLLEIAEIIHMAGENNFKFVEKDAHEILKNYENLKPSYHVFGFLDSEQLKHAYVLADLIVNRAGAGSIFEIAALGKPSIIIPILNSAQDHQRKNAYEFASPSEALPALRSSSATEGGAKEGPRAIVLEQENLSPNIFLEQISRLLSDPNKLKEMGIRAKTFYKPNIAEKIRDEIIKLTQKS